MTPPHNNDDREARRQSPALIGMAVAVTLAILAGIVVILWPVPVTDATPPAAAVESEPGSAEPAASGSDY